MFKRLLLAALCLISSPAAFAACTASIDYDAGLYGAYKDLDGVGWGSPDASRQNAAFKARTIYLGIHGQYSLPKNSTICVTYDDDSTETFRVQCPTSPSCMIPVGNHSPPAGAGGSGGAPGYYYYNSIWIYFGQTGCIGCVYWGTVGEPYTPPPSTEER
jgi:hypothetical protein